MSDVVIRVEELGKKFKLGSHMPYHRLSETLQNWAFGALRAPFKLFSEDFSRKTAEKPETPSEFWALKDINFEVKRGEVIGIIGRNGAGKSTLLKILSGITEPTQGRFGIKGRVASLLEVGTGFHSELTGRENVFLSGSILGMKRSEIQKKFSEIVEFAGVGRFIDTPVKRYSSGMMVRLGFSVAAHLQPDILIVDEVLAVGDAEFQKMCIGKLNEVSHSGRTILFVSHNVSAIQRLCQSAILLDHGRLVNKGDVDTVYHDYTTKTGHLTPEKIWTVPPGDHVAKVLAARILNSSGRVDSTISIDQPFFVEIEYELLDPTVRTTAVFHILSEEGLCIFSSNDFVNREWWETTRQTGPVKARCQIPAHFMTEGRFDVLIAVTSYNPDLIHVLQPNSLNFEIVDRTTGEGARGPFTGRWPGLIRPLFQWQIQTAGFEIPSDTAGDNR